MKSKIFMYLFLFAVLIILYMYMSQKKIYERQVKDNQDLTTKIDRLNEEIEFLKLENADLNYFTLQGNDNAMTYFENFGHEAKAIENVVNQQIYIQNTVQGDNPLVPYTGMEGIMRINKTRFLNHKWVLADFTDGRYWGEMIIQYDLDENENLTLNTIASFLYPN